MELGYCGFKRWHGVVAGHGDSMVAVHHEVDFLQLVELHRGQLLTPLKCSVYVLPPLPHACPRGQEGSVEVPPSPHTADDLLHPYNPRPSVKAIVSRMLSSDVVEGEQPVWGVLPSDTGHHRSQASPAPGAGEVRVHLLVQVHVWDHFFQPSQNGFTKYGYETRVVGVSVRVSGHALGSTRRLRGWHEQDQVDQQG